MPHSLLALAATRHSRSFHSRSFTFRSLSIEDAAFLQAEASCFSLSLSLSLSLLYFKVSLTQLFKSSQPSPAMKPFAMIMALVLALAACARANKPHVTTKDKCVDLYQAVSPFTYVHV